MIRRCLARANFYQIESIIIYYISFIALLLAYCTDPVSMAIKGAIFWNLNRYYNKSIHDFGHCGTYYSILSALSE